MHVDTCNITATEFRVTCTPASKENAPEDSIHQPEQGGQGHIEAQDSRRALQVHTHSRMAPHTCNNETKVMRIRTVLYRAVEETKA